MSINPETAISDLRRMMDHCSENRKLWSPQQRRREERLEDAQRSAVIDLFGDLNGWKQCGWFGPERIGKTSTRDYMASYQLFNRQVLFDHDLYFRWDGTTKPGRLRAAIVGQPYGEEFGVKERVDIVRNKLGLAVHVPPVAKASFWFPDATLMIVLTEPGVIVRWLPEQVSGMKL